MPALEGPPRDSVKAQDKYPLLCKIPVNFSVTRSFHSHRENNFFYYAVQKAFLTKWTGKGTTGVEKCHRRFPLYSEICLGSLSVELL